jgi:hypothetical protein
MWDRPMSNTINLLHLSTVSSIVRPKQESSHRMCYFLEKLMLLESALKLSFVCYDADVWYSARITNMFLSILRFMWAENIVLRSVPYILTFLLEITQSCGCLLAYFLAILIDETISLYCLQNNNINSIVPNLKKTLICMASEYF